MERYGIVKESLTFLNGGEWVGVMRPTTVGGTITRLRHMTIEELTTLEKLNNAFYQSAKASHWKEATQRYKANLLTNNLDLQRELRGGTYRVQPTTDFTLNERGKIRHIEAPAIRDRIVQKVLCQYVLLPSIRRHLIYDNYASLKDRGTAFARKRMDVMLQRYIRHHGDDGYILQVDIKKYFDSVDHGKLKELLYQRLDEPAEVMSLVDYIVDSSSKTGRGLNLGSEAPQIFAIYYLNGIDNYIKTVKGVKYYGRYMDDMFIISHDKHELMLTLAEIMRKLSELKLEVNEKKTHITKLSHGFTFLQIKYHVSNGRIIKRPTHDKVVRERRRLKKYKNLYDRGEMTEYDIHTCYKSWRNSVVKDCNRCDRTIRSLDALYDRLFPEHEGLAKLPRSRLIADAFKELYEPRYEDLF